MYQQRGLFLLSLLSQLALSHYHPVNEKWLLLAQNFSNIHYGYHAGFCQFCGNMEMKLWNFAIYKALQTMNERVSYSRLFTIFLVTSQAKQKNALDCSPHNLILPLIYLYQLRFVCPRVRQSQG